MVCHSNFCHPHVIQFKEIFLTPSHLGIAMEYAPGGDMFQYVKKSSGLKVLPINVVQRSLNNPGQAIKIYLLGAIHSYGLSVHQKCCMDVGDLAGGTQL